MTQPQQQQQQPPVPPPPLGPQPPGGGGGPAGGGGVQVRCAGCRMILSVASGVTEFVCPSCELPQMLPPELMSRAHQKALISSSSSTAAAAAAAAAPPPPLLPPPPSLPLPGPQVPAHGIDPTKIQLPCANCRALLNVPHGLARFNCPQCRVDLAVDVSKLKQFAPGPPALPPPPPPPEEVNEDIDPSLG